MKSIYLLFTAKSYVLNIREETRKNKIIK